MEKVLYKIWSKLCEKYTNKEYADKLWKDIVKKYNGSGRHYHNIQHISDMILKYYFVYENSLEKPDKILFAIFYHDIIYSSTRKDNEKASALFMDGRLHKTALPEKSLIFIYDAIMATKTHEMNDDQDINYLLDFDMSILGKSWYDYLDYTNNIRKEYRIYPDIIYKKGRKQSLNSFLDLERIFKTDDFYNLYEDQARNNIIREIGEL